MKLKEAVDKTEQVVQQEIKENSGLAGAVLGGIIGTAIMPFFGTAAGAWVGYKIDKRLR
ncbi:hypothetical protein D3C83_307370 [compost metagenome]